MTYELGRASSVAMEMKRHNISILSTGELTLYSGHTHNGSPHKEGVAFMLSRQVEKALVRLVMQQTT